MEDILSSIKRIIADGSDRVTPVRSLRRRALDPEEGELEAEAETSDAGYQDPAVGEEEPAILELTDMVEEPTGMNEAVATPTRKAATQKAAAQPTQAPVSDIPPLTAAQEDVILSDVSTQAARQSLSQLSSLLVRPQEGESNTLEGLVREMLRPMLKDWLEENLPDLVQSLVKKEIDRIVGRLG